MELYSLLLYVVLHATVYALSDVTIDEALMAVKEADDAMADTSYLINRLNSVLQRLNDQSCSNDDECIDDTRMELESITNEAMMLKESTIKKNLNMLMINILLYAPIAATIAAFVTTLLYTNLKSYLRRKMMEMEIKEVEEE